MASSSGKDANYWPGFVDALTNVVIAMVFVIVVLAMALSVSAQMMAKRMASKLAELESANAALSARAASSASAALSAAADDLGPRTTSRTEARLSRTTVIGVRGNESAASAPGGLSDPTQSHLVLEYASQALTLDAAAADHLATALGGVKESLAKAGATAKVVVVARGPNMQLSDNQRSAYLRLMAVRNAMLAQGLGPEQIVLRIDTTTPSHKATVSVAVQEQP